MKQYLAKVIEKQDLTQGEMTEAFDIIMSGDATPSQIAGFIVALRMKGETVDEIAGGAASMRQHAVLVDPGGLPVVDTCGTGGDSCDTFNISTTSALVVAGAGVPVAKHGNRAISSKCGSADVLAALGVNLDVPPEVEEEAIREAGIGFLFAPGLHPAMKYAMPPRKEMGVRTIFNMLGPLTNPAGAKCQIIGVFSPELTEPFAHVLRLLGSKRAFIVHGHDGMDEMTTTTSTRVSELVDGQVKTYDFDPLELLEDYADPADLAGGDAETNAAITRSILEGKAGAPRDIVCLNAGAAIVAGGKAANLKEGFVKAQESIDSGGALKALEMLVEVTNL
ncbi:MAG: anthranilate phosphoribosyltransferase [Kiritimatiellia bacterium]|jgi:anthranilate phosphoribosyltransferase|nr:anthranilate phosphoribosyltransferase [Kiritimatiellia bacterium]MDP6630765.1 anthranilate phosphoribosyltransferase [Kiritimatiellia bacterium]MDP6809371.1 anthranilate phosphoribosyltransferase [Kiritimatiellia bacterium]MDP7023951.1 anthranilate phosphoribosyltransferase [Kiritimatiellia bacterium]